MKWAELRRDIPALSDGIFVNYGAHGPSPRPVVRAAYEFLQRHEYVSPTADDPYDMADRSLASARNAVAGLIGCTPVEVALTTSTTAGIAAVANAIDIGPGDVVVRTDLEHPGGILPWQRLARDGVEVRVVKTDGGRVPLDTFAAAVEDATLACFSAITWTHGTRLPVGELVDIAHEAGALTVVDAVQVPGQVPMDVKKWGAHVVAAAGHKWLLGLWGGGFLYVDGDVIDRFRPRVIGSKSVVEPTADAYTYHPGAARFEVGTANPAPHVALGVAISCIRDVGVSRIESRIGELVERLIDGIPPHRLLSPDEPESGLVTVEVADPAATVERARHAGIVPRALPYPDAIRFSIHAVNTADEIDRILEWLETEWS